MPNNCVFSASGQFLDIFRTSFRHFSDIPFFWAVQRFARHNTCTCFGITIVMQRVSRVLLEFSACGHQKEKNVDHGGYQSNAKRAEQGGEDV